MQRLLSLLILSPGHNNIRDDLTPQAENTRLRHLLPIGLGSDCVVGGQRKSFRIAAFKE